MNEENLEQKLNRKREELRKNSQKYSGEGLKEPISNQNPQKYTRDRSWEPRYKRISIAVGIAMLALPIGGIFYENSQKNRQGKNDAQIETVVADSSQNSQVNSAVKIQSKDNLDNIVRETTVSADIPEFIRSDYTITSGEYNLNHDIIVEKNGKLTIIGGTKIAFDRYKGITVRGGLIQILGLEDKRVVLNSTSASGKGWRGIKIEDSANDNWMEFMILLNVNNKDETGFLHAGGIELYNSKLHIDQSTIRECITSMAGGICCMNSDLYIKNSSITNNLSAGNGGGISAFFSRLYIENSTISENRTDGNGGGIYLNMSEATLQDSYISKNFANKGGGIYHGDPTVKQTLNNERTVLADESKIKILGSTIIENNNPDNISEYINSEPSANGQGTAYIETSYIDNTKTHSPVGSVETNFSEKKTDALKEKKQEYSTTKTLEKHLPQIGHLYSINDSTLYCDRVAELFTHDAFVFILNQNNIRQESYLITPDRFNDLYNQNKVKDLGYRDREDILEMIQGRLDSTLFYTNNWRFEKPKTAFGRAWKSIRLFYEEAQRGY
ncbi:MAG: hypothetical protein ACP5NW_04820 [Candidatus Woesearchaeota archaeon]